MVREWLGERLAGIARRAGLGADEALAARVAALEEERNKLEKRLSMTMGAMTAATAQIVQLRQELEHTANLARQASQQATSAFAMAESAAEGVHALEEER